MFAEWIYNIMKIKDLVFIEDIYGDAPDESYLYYCYLDKDSKRLTVLNRVTGYSDCRWEIESGYQDEKGNFFLYIGFDIREHPESTVEEIIETIKANSCVCKYET